MAKKKPDPIEEVRSLWAEMTLENNRWSRWRDQSLAVFLRRLPAAKVLEAVEISLSRMEPETPVVEKRAWKYFCGVCWTMIREAEDET